MTENKEPWPPKLTFMPNGVANLFLMTHCPSAGAEASEALVELFKLYWERGKEDANASRSTN